DAVRFLVEVRLLKIPGKYIDGNMHTGSSRINHLSFHLYNLTNLDGFIKPYTAYIHSYRIIAAPGGRAGIAGLVYPFHYAAAMHVAAVINIAGFGYKLKTDRSVYHNSIFNLKLMIKPAGSPVNRQFSSKFNTLLTILSIEVDKYSMLKID